MKNIYAVKKIEIVHNEDWNSYLKRYEETPDTIIEGLSKVFEYCGGKLFRGRNCCYGGQDSKYEYVAIRIQ